MIKAILLDLDDTLCLTQKASLKLQNEALKRMGRKAINPAIHLKTWGMVLPESMKLRSPGVDFDTFKAHYDDIINEYADRGELDLVPQENLKALEQLISHGFYVAILTSRSNGQIRHLLHEKHALSSLITDIYHLESSYHHKPDPRVFDPFFERKGYLPSECVYVGDSPSDAAASNGAGITFIASLEGGLKSERDFDKHEVAYFINKFTELPAAIHSLGK